MQICRLLIALSLGATVMLFPAETQGVGLDVGDRFPDLVLPSLDGGEPTSIASFRGRKLALHVWASW